MYLEKVVLAGEVAQQVRALTALLKVLSSSHLIPLLECLKTATVYLYIINKSLKKFKNPRPSLGYPFDLEGHMRNPLKAKPTNDLK